MAAPAVDLSVPAVVDLGGVEVLVARGAGEAALVPVLQEQVQVQVQVQVPS